MDQLIEGTMDTREIIKGKLRQCFDGKIVRKDLTKKIKEGATGRNSEAGVGDAG